MTNGQNYAVQILTARDLGLEPNLATLAERYLKKATIEPTFIIAFEREARIAVKRINEKGLVKEAIKTSQKYIGQCQPNTQK